MSKDLELPLRSEDMRGPAVDRWEARIEFNTRDAIRTADMLRNWEKVREKATAAIRRALQR